MELFSEIYNCYFKVVARIMEEAMSHPITRQDITIMAETYGYEESALTIVPSLIDGSWKLLSQVKCDMNPPSSPDMKSGRTAYGTVLHHIPMIPLTALQKSWLKSLMKDPRISLFFSDEQLAHLQEYFKDTTPLYKLSDFLYFDKYADGDQFHLDSYRRHFRQILNAIHSHQALRISYYSGKGRIMEYTYLPCLMEYSPKDDKFRLYALYRKKNGRDRIDQLNIGRILRIEATGFYSTKPIDINAYLETCLCREPVVLEISNERNALERTTLHFSCYQKKVERLEASGKYLCSIYYDKTRETELLIQVLSFGPVVKVLGPDNFLQQIRERVKRQAKLTNTVSDTAPE